MQHPISGQTFRWRTSLLLIFAVLISTPLYATLSVRESSDSITVHIGSGSNVSYLAFAESSLNSKSIIYAWHYDELTNPNTPPRTGLDLYNSVHGETAGSPWAVSYSTDAFGLTTSFSIGPTTSRVVDPLANPAPVWTYWIQGGSEYVGYGDNRTTFTFLVGNSLIVSPAYWDTRYISNGSYDVWTITPFSYTEVPSDTHEYTDISGQAQTVTFGTYEGSAPVLKTPPTIVSSRILTDGKLEIVFATIQGGIYQLEEKENLLTNGWHEFSSPFTATENLKTFILPTDHPSKRGFYRLIRKE
jgi:hypothetical protein